MKAVILFFFLVICGQSFSQVVYLTDSVRKAKMKFGARIGVNLANNRQGGFLTSLGSLKAINPMPKLGVNASVFTRLPLREHIFFQPELQFSMEGHTQDAVSSSGQSKVNDLELIYFNLPLTIQYHMPKGFFIEGGVQAGYLTSGKLTRTNPGSTSPVVSDVKALTSGIPLGALMGLGYTSEFDFGFYIRYNLGLNNILTVSGSQVDLAARTISAGFQVYF